MSNARAATSGRDEVVVRVSTRAAITMRNVTGRKLAVAMTGFVRQAVRSALFWDPELMAHGTIGAVGIARQLRATRGGNAAHSAQGLCVSG
jgi:hypothetical protein